MAAIPGTGSSGYLLVISLVLAAELVVVAMSRLRLLRRQRPRSAFRLGHSAPLLTVVDRVLMAR